MAKSDTVTFEMEDNFQKQTNRNRMYLYSPNGAFMLNIPVKNSNSKQMTKDVRIETTFDWQKQHFKTLEASYRNSPFFEYYEDDFISFYESKKTDSLIDFNEAFQQQILKLLKLKPAYSFTTEYKEEYPETDDFRSSINPKIGIESDTDFTVKPYWQVFETKHGFIPNLSIVDLLFNQGSKASEFL